MLNKIAVVVCGWHYPSHFYQALAKQALPEGWEMHLFVVGHRDPIHSHNEKNLILNSKNLLDILDCILYKTPVTVEFLNNLGWMYIEGESGCEWQAANTWLDNIDYTEYDCILIAGDDALILNDRLIYDAVTNQINLLDNFKEHDRWKSKPASDTNWLVISNSRQPRQLSIRGSFEFFKPEVISYIGGKFDLSKITLSRKGEVTTPSDYNALTDWNKYISSFIHKMAELNLYDKIKYMSDHYRVSDYVIECERGLLSNANTLAPDYISKIEKLYNDGKFDNILNEYNS